MAKTNLTPAELTLRGRLGAHVMWAETEDRTARTQAARRAFQRRFENQVDRDGVLDPAERAKRAEHARQAHMLKMAMASARARRLRAQAARIDAQLANDEALVAEPDLNSPDFDSIELTPIDEQVPFAINESCDGSCRIRPAAEFGADGCAPGSAGGALNHHESGRGSS